MKFAFLGIEIKKEEKFTCYMPHPFIKSTTKIDEKIGNNVIFKNISLTQTLEINTN